MAKGKPAVKEYPLAHLVEKDITPKMQTFADWLRDQTGYDVDDRSVALAGTQRMLFQKSEENQEALAKQRAASEAAKAAREQARENKAAAKAEPKAKPAPKAPAGKTAAAAKAAPKPAPRRRRAAADDDL